MNEPQPNNLIGIAFVLLTCATMTISALLIRTIGKDLGSFEVVFIRCSFSVCYILILNMRKGKSLFHSPRPFLLGFRSLTLSIIVLGNFYAIINLPLVQVTTLQFTKPLFLVILAALFLGEKIRLPRTIATLFGFVGVIIILQPDSTTIELAQIAVLSAAICMAVIAVITKKMTKDHTTSTLLFFGNLFIVLICLGPTIANWTAPSLFQVALIAGLGLTAYAGQASMVQAYRYGEATAVTPFEYVRIIFMAAAAYIAFGEVPDNDTILGAIIICAATLFIAFREAHKKRQNKDQKT